MGQFIKIERNIWDYETEPEIVGVLKQKIQSQFVGDDFLINTKDKGDILVFGKTVLKNKLRDITEGTLLKIVYLGTKTNDKTKRSYEDFDVYKWKD